MAVLWEVQMDKPAIVVGSSVKFEVLLLTTMYTYIFCIYSFCFSIIQVLVLYLYGWCAGKNQYYSSCKGSKLRVSLHVQSKLQFSSSSSFFEWAECLGSSTTLGIQLLRIVVCGLVWSAQLCAGVTYNKRVKGGERYFHITSVPEDFSESTVSFVCFAVVV